MKVNYNIRTLFFILLTSIALEVASQSRHHIYNNQVKLSPFRIIDPVHSGIEISYEKKHVGNYSTQLSVAYFIKNNFSSNYEDYRGYRLGLEEKYFLPKRVSNIYLSVEAVYQKNSFQSTASFIHDSSNSAPSFHYVDSIKIHRRAAIINARIGRQLMVNRFVADVSIGIGVRFRKVMHEGKIYSGDRLPPSRHPNIPYEANREKNDAALNLPLNLRIGFMF